MGLQVLFKIPIVALAANRTLSTSSNCDSYLSHSACSLRESASWPRASSCSASSVFPPSKTDIICAVAYPSAHSPAHPISYSPVRVPCPSTDHLLACHRAGSGVAKVRPPPRAVFAHSSRALAVGACVVLHVVASFAHSQLACSHAFALTFFRVCLGEADLAPGRTGIEGE
ncbi:uncharacterized protein C8Q71DRAFT_786095, partial [Rhodofomes roseus]